LFHFLSDGVKIARVYFRTFVDKFYFTLWSTDPRVKQKFVFNLIDIDGDGLIKGPDLMKCEEMIDMDGKFGREIKILLDHYVKTHLRIAGKPKETDRINLDSYINFLVKTYGKNG